MALSIYKKLGLQEPQPTCISIQLADRTLTYPRGMVEDLLVKVDKFIFPTNFMILDIEEDKDIPIILRWPFLNTRGALLDVKKGKLTWRLGDEEEVFKVFGNAKSSFSLQSYNFMQVTNKIKFVIAMSHPSKGNKDLPRKKFISKAPGYDKKKGDDINIHVCVCVYVCIWVKIGIFFRREH